MSVSQGGGEAVPLAAHACFTCHHTKCDRASSSFFTASEASGPNSSTHFLSPSTRCSTEMPRVFRRSFNGSMIGRMLSRGKGKALLTGSGNLLKMKAAAAEQRRNQVRQTCPALQPHHLPIYWRLRARAMRLGFPLKLPQGLCTCCSTSLELSFLR